MFITSKDCLIHLMIWHPSNIDGWLNYSTTISSSRSAIYTLFRNLFIFCPFISMYLYVSFDTNTIVTSTTIAIILFMKLFPKSINRTEFIVGAIGILSFFCKIIAIAVKNNKTAEWIIYIEYESSPNIWKSLVLKTTERTPDSNEKTRIVNMNNMGAIRERYSKLDWTNKIIEQTNKNSRILPVNFEMVILISLRYITYAYAPPKKQYNPRIAEVFNISDSKYIKKKAKILIASQLSFLNDLKTIIVRNSSIYK